MTEGATRFWAPKPHRNVPFVRTRLSASRASNFTSIHIVVVEILNLQDAVGFEEYPEFEKLRCKIQTSREFMEVNSLLRIKQSQDSLAKY